MAKIVVELDEKVARAFSGGDVLHIIPMCEQVKSALAAHDAKKVLPKPPRAPTTIYSPFFWDDVNDDADERYCDEHGVLVCRPFGGFVDAETKHPVLVEGYPVPPHTQPRWVASVLLPYKQWRVLNCETGLWDVCGSRDAAFAEAARRNAAEK